MISHLADSDWLIDYLRGKTEALALLTPFIERANLATSIVAYAEVYEGILGSTEKDRLLVAFSDVIAGVPVLGVDAETAHTFASLRAGLRAQGLPIPDHDLWIAATAMRYDLTLVTRDRHFERLPDLKRL
jgi:tRNA(fMet)-specific endonuclease VapC